MIDIPTMDAGMAARARELAHDLEGAIKDLEEHGYAVYFARSPLIGGLRRPLQIVIQKTVML